MLDPLSSVLDGTDPLSLFAATADPLLSMTTDNARKKRDKDESLCVGSDFEPWSSKRGEILARYTTNEKLSINLYMGSEKGKASTPGSTVSEKVRTRLEELDDLEEGSQKELLNLTQQDYTNRIEELNQSLKDAWASDQKVKALKIVIQCSKLLSDTTVIQFYPSKFVLITDILDTFGKLVYERIFSMCADHCTPLPAFEEIQKCTELFLRKSREEISFIWFLKQVGMEVAPHLKDNLNKNFFDFLLTFKQVHGDTVQNQLVAQGVEIPSYLTLYSPAIDWILQCIAYRAAETLLTEMMERCRKLGNNALLLNSVMSAFRAEFIAARAMDFIGMIKECDESGFPKHLLFCSLGQNLALADPPESDRLQILNEAWKVITKLKSPQKREVNTILADVIKHMTPDRAFEEAYPQLQSMIQKVIAYLHDFAILFSLHPWVELCLMKLDEDIEHFLIFQWFREKDKKTEASFFRTPISHQQESTKDPVILNALLHVCKTMHDSVKIQPMVFDVKPAGQVSFGRDFEQQLNFYVEARSMFCNLEPVLVQLIHSVNQLAMETRKVMKGNHSRKTAAFVRACVAFCFITIPSLTGIFTHLNLYLHSGQVALANQCLSQADAFFRAAISLVPEVPKMINIDGKLRPSEAYLLEFLCNFFSTLLIVPDHPEQGVLFLVRGLLNVIQDYTWEDNSDDKVKIYTNVVHLLSAMGQETYLYHIDKVESNDTLYGGDTKFLAETSRLCETVISQILEHLKNLGKDEVKTLEYIKLQSKHPEFRHFTELTLRLPLQSRT
ncbi:hypothetical protein L345_09057 [Ophiophagus hannah]|uniref:VPS35 endosomal protein-sorting factor-like n=1 Tax=Ophiophagus hannah TaxID=8665 RepID=V8NSD0_OPHHA|nr:hypothetical protein L345_09057 [Ophiophagus hannah]